jgi:hypothetical protein
MSEKQTQEQMLVGGVGVVRVGDLEVTVAPLPLSAESVLDRRLRRGAQERHGDYYTRCRAMLDAMADYPGDRLEAVREITRMTASGAAVSAAAVVDFRLSPEGVALELYARGRGATPGLTLEGLKAIITEANVDEVAGQLHAAIEAGDPKPTR